MSNAIEEQTVNTIVPPLFTFCSPTLEQEQNENIGDPRDLLFYYMSSAFTPGGILNITIDTPSKT